MNSYYVYMMANYTNSVLYIGVTNDLVRRTAEHKSHVIDGFTSRNNCKKLVYYEEFEHIESQKKSYLQDIDKIRELAANGKQINNELDIIKKQSKISSTKSDIFFKINIL